MKVRTIASMSAETSALIFQIRALKVGEVLTYEAMSKTVGYDVRDRRGPLNRARHRVRLDDQIHTETVEKVGLKRLSHEEAAGTVPNYLRRARNAARRGREVVRNIDVSEVPQDKRAALFAGASLLELIDYGGSAKAQTKALEAAKDGEDHALPLHRMLAALKE